MWYCVKQISCTKKMYNLCYSYKYIKTTDIPTYFMCTKILINFRDFNAVVSCAIYMLILICNVRRVVLINKTYFKTVIIQ
jgi:hypothetical protein